MNEAMVREWVQRCGIEIAEEKGGELWAPCPDPDHSDHNPSWSINAETGQHFCFSCHFGGGLRTLVRTVLGDGEAQGLRLDSDAPPVQSLNRRLDPAFRPIRRLPSQRPSISEAELVLFADAPQWALDARRLDRGSVDWFGIRWSEKEEAWVLPLRWDDGSLLCYQVKGQNRSFVRNRPRGTPMSHTLFGLLEARDPSCVVLVESPLDAALLHTIGYQAVALCGSRMSDHQRNLLQHYDLVVLALDNDDAGRKETARIVRSMPGFEYRVLDYGDSRSVRDPDRPAKDVGEMEVDDVDRRLHGLVG